MLVYDTAVTRHVESFCRFVWFFGAHAVCLWHHTMFCACATTAMGLPQGWVAASHTCYPAHANSSAHEAHMEILISESQVYPPQI
jgi:hypothetical protein